MNKKAIHAALLALGLAAGCAHAGDNRFCGGPLAHAAEDQSLEFVVEQPANLTVCMSGYELEKCGDHETAARIYDKCIGAGYMGSLIHKARMLETGTSSNPPDPAAATELMQPGGPQRPFALCDAGQAALCQRPLPGPGRGARRGAGASLVRGGGARRQCGRPGVFAHRPPRRRARRAGRGVGAPQSAP